MAQTKVVGLTKLQRKGIISEHDLHVLIKPLNVLMTDLHHAKDTYETGPGCCTRQRAALFRTSFQI